MTSSATKHTEVYILAEAALVAGRSISWIRSHRRFGPLVPAMIGGRQAVTAASLHMLIQSKPTKARDRTGRTSHLRLIIDNTK
jgi:hypothetical protein